MTCPIEFPASRVVALRRIMNNQNGMHLICRSLNSLTLIGRVGIALYCLFPGVSAQAQESGASQKIDTAAKYPRTLTSDKGSITLYAPQIEAWDNFETLTAYMAFQITLNDTGRSPYGAIDFTAHTEVDLSNREVLLYDLRINKLNIPGLQNYEIEYHVLQQAFENNSKTVPLDLIIEYLPDSLPLPATKGLAVEPPPIYVSTEPAILLIIDTEPIYLPAGESGMEVILNANWNVFRETGKEDLYLLGPDGWLTASSLEGPWSRATQLPEAFRKLPDDPNWEQVIAALPEDLSGFMVIQSMPPRIITTMVPAELILFQGTPQWQAIGESDLEYATNTTSEVFRTDAGIFFLASGRWFKTSGLDAADWTLEGQLPAAFQTIPTDHPKAYVRASVPGTREAWEAALVASIPISAKFSREAAADLAPELDYAGDPVFFPIEGTEIEVAYNTSYQVLKYEGVYYLCYNATWFTSPEPTGPWTFADSIPDAFAAIPPSSPAFNTTYVTVQQSNADSITYTSTAGYTNSYVSESGTVVNGSGFVQSAVAVWMVYEIADNNDYYHYPHYPYYPYYPWPPSYGYGSWYNPNTGFYGESMVAYGPYGAARSTAVYNPKTGVYGRGQAVWDSDEVAGRRYAYNPNTDTSTSRRGYYDFDDNEGWSERVTRRGDEWVYSESDWDDGSVRTDFETSRGGEGTTYRERNGDTSSGSGSFETGSGKQIETDFSREKQGDTTFTDRTISGENRSVDINGAFEDGQGAGYISGSEGGVGSVTREFDNGELTGTGSFSKDGKTIDSETTRSAEGVKREFESSEGGQAVTGRKGDQRGFAAETGSGDVYAGKDGEVYKKTDSGWEQVDSKANAEGRSSQASSTSRTSRAAAEDYGPGRPSSVQAPSDSPFKNQQAERISPSRSQQLDRDQASRQRGYGRYDSFQSSRSGQSFSATPTRTRRR
jgi:hypothetical protein